MEKASRRRDRRHCIFWNEGQEACYLGLFWYDLYVLIHLQPDNVASDSGEAQAAAKEKTVQKKEVVVSKHVISKPVEEDLDVDDLLENEWS